MRTIIKLISIFLIIPSLSFSQETDWIYANMFAQDAQTLKGVYPNGIEILSLQDDLAAVYVQEEVAQYLHENVIIHGPGYFLRKSEADAKSFIQESFTRRFDVMDFTITEDAFVGQCLDMVNEDKIEETILMLQDFGTRYHQRPEAEQAIYDLRDKWQAMATAAGRTDVTFEIVEHWGTPMPSLIMTIPGATEPDEYVIIGGHADSITNNQSNAPGADDNASGIGTVTEVIRVLLEAGYHPQKTVQFMAYAAEEVGLVGSDEIAEDYYADGKNVVAYVQFDMTNYQGSSDDVAIIQDNYTSGDLNIFLMELMEHYNATGSHTFSYTTSQCNYACSDHASWETRGYLASFPFESRFGEHNPNIHTVNDLYSVTNSSEHAAKFSKLGLEFIIEVAKRSVLSTNDVENSEIKMVVKNKELIYEIPKVTGKIESLTILDTSARKVLIKNNLSSSGKVSLQTVPAGIYLAVFRDSVGKSFAKKILVK